MNAKADKWVPAPRRMYIRAILLLSFVSSFVLYLGYDLAAAVVLLLSAGILLFAARTDRIVFDGKRISRTGFLASVWKRLTGSRMRLRTADVEQVETRALRVFRRGGRITYRYETVISGKGIEFLVISAGRRYLGFMRVLLAAVPEDALDLRSLELRDHLADPEDVRARAESAHIPSGDVLEETLFKRGSGTASSARAADNEAGQDETKIQTLRKLANELKIAGSMHQALEAFRRALRLDAGNAWLLFECARCLCSTARSQKDRKLERRALALMRLAERRGAGDPVLLTRLGESYIRLGYWKNAESVFRKVADGFGASFRLLRGMAGLSLREGKIAYVIHNFAAAEDLASTRALKRWASREAEYFSMLHANDEYMEMELSRVNLADWLNSVAVPSIRIAILGFTLVPAGLLLEEALITNFGWAVSGIAIVFRLVTGLLGAMLSARLPVDSFENE